MQTQATRRGPRYRTPSDNDRRLQREVQMAIAMMAETQQQVALAFGVSEARVSQMVRDWPTMRAFLAKAFRAARHSHADGLALVIPAVVEVARAGVEGLTDRGLAAVKRRLLDDWMTSDADEQRATIDHCAGRCDGPTFAATHLREAITSLHLAAIAYEEERRGCQA